MPPDREEVFDDFIDEVLNEPASVDSAPTGQRRILQEPRSIPVVSAPVFVREGRRMERMLNVVTAVRVIGSGLLQDLSKIGRDIVGGRAATVESSLAGHLEDLRRDIAAKAFSAGGSVVVSYKVEVGTYGGGLTILIATGTPVVLSLLEGA